MILLRSAKVLFTAIGVFLAIFGAGMASAMMVVPYFAARFIAEVTGKVMRWCDRLDDRAYLFLVGQFRGLSSKPEVVGADLVEADRIGQPAVPIFRKTPAASGLVTPSGVVSVRRTRHVVAEAVGRGGRHTSVVLDAQTTTTANLN